MFPCRWGLAACLAVVLCRPCAAQPQVQGKKPLLLDSSGDPLPRGAVARLGTLRFRHETNVCRICFSPDGKSLTAKGGWGDLVRWEVATGKRLASRDEVLGFAQSPDGTLLAWTGKDATMHLCETVGGKEIRKIAPGQVQGYTMAFSPDGKVLAWEGKDRAVHLTDVATGKEVGQLAKQEGSWSTESVGFTPDGKSLLVGTREIGDYGRMSVWDLTSGKKSRQFRIRLNRDMSSCLSPDGKLLAAAAQDAVLRLWDLATGKAIRRLGKGELYTAAFAPDGRTLAAATWEKDDRPGERVSIRLWDVATGRELWRCRGWPIIHALAFSPDGKSLAVGGGDDGIRLFDTGTGKALSEDRAPFGNIWSIAVSPDGKAVATTGTDCILHIWDLPGGKLNRRIEGHRHFVYSVAYSPDGKRLASSSADETIRLWDANTGKELRSSLLTESVKIPMVAFSPQGRVIPTAKTDGFAADAKLWVGQAESETCKTLHWVGDEDSPAWDSVLSPDGRMFALRTNPTGSFQIGDLESGKFLRRVGDLPVDGRQRSSKKDFPSFRETMAFSQDGRTLACQDQDYGVRLWETATGLERGWLKGQEEGFLCVAFSPDGRMLATGGWDGMIRLWDPASGKELCRAGEGEARASVLTFSPDGRFLFSGWRASTLVWEVSQLVGAERNPTKPLASKEFDALWDGLAGKDAGKAYQAIHTLRLAGANAVRELGSRLRPAKSPVMREHITRLLDDLDSNRFEVRARAMRELEALGAWAAPLIHDRLRQSPSLEYRRRAEDLLRALRVKEEHGPQGEELQSVRAIETLEYIGTVEAINVLKGLSKGASESRQTQEAEQAIKRLPRTSATR